MSTYQLIDCGNRKKLEQIGDYKIIRPAPQAIWEPFNPDLWVDIDSEFVKTKGEKGEWKARKNPDGIKRYQLGTGIPVNWEVDSPSGLQWKVEPNDYGNIGIFAEHWLYSNLIANSKSKKPSVLSLFSYSGSNCLDLVKAGARVTVVDSAKTAMNDYTYNLGLNNLSREGQRLILEDTTKFTDREIRRGSKYDIILCDAPSYGRGTKGEIFDIDEQLLSLIHSCRDLLDSKGTLIFTLHSPRYTLSVLNQAFSQVFSSKTVTVEELLLECISGAKLPSGIKIEVK